MTYKLTSPLLSIILPSYNAGKYLQEAVESVINQTYTSYELLILDDGSTDGCTDFLNNISDNRIRLIRRKHNYIATINYGLSVAKGKYIARIDADDKMFPTRLADQVAVKNLCLLSYYFTKKRPSKIFKIEKINRQTPYKNALIFTKQAPF